MSLSKRGLIRSILFSSFVWLLCLPAADGAVSISFGLTNATLSVASGGTVTFDGTVTNDSGMDLNASDFFFNFSGYDPTSVTPIQDLGVNTDFLIPDGTTSSTVALFDVALGNVSAGSSFPIQVQLEDANNDLSPVETVTVSAAGTTVMPEPSALWLVAVGILCIVIVSKRRRSAVVPLFLFCLLGMLGARSQAKAQTISTLTPTAGPVGGHFFIELPITNVGAASAADVELTAVTWSTASMLSPALPVSIGTLSAGGSHKVTFTFNASGLTAGKKYLLNVRGTYQTATGTEAFSVNRFVEAGVFSPQYAISTLASSSATGIVFDGKGVAVDAANNVFATATVPGSGGIGAFSEILRVNSTGVTTIVGSNSSSNPFPGCGDPATSIQMTDLGGMGVDHSDNVYVAQSGGGPVLQVAGGIVNCMAGGQNFGAFGIVPDSLGDAYFSTSGASLVYKANAAAATVVAGTGVIGCTGAQIGKAIGLALDAAGNLYIADQWCNAIWKVSASGKVAVAGIPGNSNTGFSGDGGPATSATLSAPSGVAVDRWGNIYIAESAGARIRKVADGIINTIAGTGSSGFSGDGGPARDAKLDEPYSIAVGLDGKVYVGEAGDIGDGGDRIRVLTPVP